MSRQLALTYTTHGGARRGAGRKPKGARPSVPHVPRPAIDPRHPALVTLRVRQGVPNLRTQRSMAALRRAFAEGCARFEFRLVHFAVMSNHVHFIVEAKGKRALSRGMQGLGIRMARRLNGAVGRAGSVFADRYHARSLGTPRQVRNALAYVLLNRQRHGDGRRIAFVGSALDPCSSGDVFDGWIGRAPPLLEDEVPRLTAPAATWLLTHGWRRHGAIDPRAIPGPQARAGTEGMQV